MALNFKPLQKKINQITREVALQYSEEVDKVIRSESAFSDLGFVNQDIVDTSRLVNSKNLRIIRKGDVVEYEFSWEARSPDTGELYPALIISGFFAYGGTKFVRGRNYPNRAMKNIKPVLRFKEQAKRKLGVQVRILADRVDALPS